MRLALAEMWRRRGRWLSIVAAAGFIVFLVLFLAALADGLFNGNTGALRNSAADLFVFSAEGRRSLVRSELPLDEGSAVAAVDGVADVGALGVLLTTAGPGDESFDIAVMGYVPQRPGEPQRLISGRRLDPGEDFVGLADVALETEGVGLGDEVTVTGSAQPVTVVGFVEDSQLLLAGTMWVSVDTWRAIRSEVRPETVGRGAVVQAFPVALTSGTDVVAAAAAIDRALGTTETVTTQTAMLSIPGVDQQERTFNAIIGVSFLVVAIVIALFYALLTLERRGQLAILKAIGSSNGLLLGGILLQAAAAGLLGFLLGFGLSRVMAAGLPRDVPVEFVPATGIWVFVATVVMAIVGAAFSFRRVIRIDPASALGGEL